LITGSPASDASALKRRDIQSGLIAAPNSVVNIRPESSQAPAARRSRRRRDWCAWPALTLRRFSAYVVQDEAARPSS
jgi:hypothetical protein